MERCSPERRAFVCQYEYLGCTCCRYWPTASTGQTHTNALNTTDITTTPMQRGITRLKRILLSESAYLIWTLRCDRVIGSHTSTRAAITTKWKNTIAARLDIDRRLAKSNRRNYSKTKVLHTWSPLISDLDSLPPDWTTNLEVLVGIKLPRPPAVTGDTR